MTSLQGYLMSWKNTLAEVPPPDENLAKVLYRNLKVNGFVSPAPQMSMQQLQRFLPTIADTLNFVLRPEHHIYQELLLNIFIGFGDISDFYSHMLQFGQACPVKLKNGKREFDQMKKMVAYVLEVIMENDPDKRLMCYWNMRANDSLVHIKDYLYKLFPDFLGQSTQQQAPPTLSTSNATYFMPTPFGKTPVPQKRGRGRPRKDSYPSVVMRSAPSPRPSVPSATRNDPAQDLLHDTHLHTVPVAPDAIENGLPTAAQEMNILYKEELGASCSPAMTMDLAPRRSGRLSIAGNRSTAVRALVYDADHQPPMEVEQKEQLPVIPGPHSQEPPSNPTVPVKQEPEDPVMDVDDQGTRAPDNVAEQVQDSESNNDVVIKQENTLEEVEQPQERLPSTFEDFDSFRDPGEQDSVCSLLDHLPHDDDYDVLHSATSEDERTSIRYSEGTVDRATAGTDVQANNQEATKLDLSKVKTEPEPEPEPVVFPSENEHLELDAEEDINVLRNKYNVRISTPKTPHMDKEAIGGFSQTRLGLYIDPALGEFPELPIQSQYRLAKTNSLYPANNSCKAMIYFVKNKDALKDKELPEGIPMSMVIFDDQMNGHVKTVPKRKRPFPLITDAVTAMVQEMNKKKKMAEKEVKKAKRGKTVA